jgi:hypothetical protein
MRCGLNLSGTKDSGSGTLTGVRCRFEILSIS